MNPIIPIERPFAAGAPVHRSTPEEAGNGVRSVEAIHSSTGFHWVGNGFFVSTYFPSEKLPSQRVSPFVLMDYGPPKEFTPLARGKRGVGWHPHRGFETVTLAWEGSVAHRDNAGHRGVIGPGGAQWMTAASGIFHEEYHEQELTRRGGRLHMMQLWVNLPSKDKTAPPGYQSLDASQLPTVALRGGGSVRVLAGEYEGARGPARTFTPITVLDVRLRSGEELSVTLPASYNALAVIAEGEAAAGNAGAGNRAAGNRAASTGELILFSNDAGRLALTASRDTHLIVLAGEPIHEPLVQYGPFVMNTVAEIQQAIVDVNSGKFGPVPE